MLRNYEPELKNQATHEEEMKKCFEKENKNVE